MITVKFFIRIRFEQLILVFKMGSVDVDERQIQVAKRHQGAAVALPH